MSERIYGLFIFGICFNVLFGVFRLFKFARVGQYMHIIRQRAVRLGDYLLLGFFIFWLLLIAHWLACGWIYLRGFPEAMGNLTKYFTSQANMPVVLINALHCLPLKGAKRNNQIMT